MCSTSGSVVAVETSFSKAAILHGFCYCDPKTTHNDNNGVYDDDDDDDDDHDIIRKENFFII